MPFLKLLTALLLFMGCSAHKKVIQTDLYFGLSINPGEIIADSLWTAFIQQQVCKVFVEGFTVVDAEGKWLDRNTGKLISEPARVIMYTHRSPNRALSVKIDSLRAYYKRAFRQRAVLRIDRKVRASL